MQELTSLCRTVSGGGTSWTGADLLPTRPATRSKQGPCLTAVLYNFKLRLKLIPLFAVAIF